MVMELEYDRSIFGKEYEAGPFEVSKEQILAFSKSVGDTNPIFNDPAAARSEGYADVVAHPTFCTLMVGRVQLPDIKLKFGRIRMNGGQRIQPRGHIIAGDMLMASSHLKDVYPKTGRSGTMVFIVWETTFRNQRGEVVVDAQVSTACRE